MKKLNKIQASEKEALILELELIAMDESEMDIPKYNEAVARFNDWIQNIRDSMQNYYDDRSESWQESDAGYAYQDWMDAWDLNIEEIVEYDEVVIPGNEELPDEP